jgi:EAL domain-containing protein (putative c-di-GMP-specific phosphodiesterase class I)
VLGATVERAVADVSGQEVTLAARVATLDLDVGDLAEGDVAKALAYAVNSFVADPGAQFTLQSLRQGLSDAVSKAASQLSGLKRVIERAEIQLAFQPIVALNDRAIHHHEALSRFSDGRDPYEVITFGEATGLIEELDLAVCRMVLQELKRSPESTIALNISGRSAQSDAFRRELQAVLAAHGDVRRRLIIELTESSAIADEHVEEAAAFLVALRADGNRVCLDDFGAGAAAYSYLRHFEVDYVKIDGPFLKAAVTKERERTLIRSICELCEGLGSQTIGEMIEDEQQSKIASRLGIRFGQGWLFGRPLSSLAPVNRPVRVGKRKGAVERWE